MVGVSTGAGGELIIRGSIDTKDIERGFARISVGFDNIENKTDSFNSDLTRMNVNTRRLAKGFANLAVIGVTAMVGLAKGAPAVAPAMARIGVQFDRLQRTLGRALRPEFEAFASGFEKFVNFADAHPDVLSGFALTAGSIAGVKALGLLFGVTVSPTVITALALLGATGTALGGLENVTNKIREQVTGGQDMTLNLPISQGLQDSPPGLFNPLSFFGKVIEPFEILVRDFLGKKKQLENSVPLSQTEENRKFQLLNFVDVLWG